MAENKKVVLCMSCMVFCILSAVSFAEFAIASLNENDSCMGNDRTNISLVTWLYVDAACGLFIAFFGALYIYWMTREPQNNSPTAIIIVLILMIIVSFFSFAWFVIGIVILARSNRDCVTQETDLGIMMIFTLCTHTLGIMCGMCGKSRSDD